MSDYSEKVCEACQPDADPATKEEINEFCQVTRTGN